MRMKIEITMESIQDEVIIALDKKLYKHALELMTVLYHANALGQITNYMQQQYNKSIAKISEDIVYHNDSQLFN